MTIAAPATNDGHSLVERMWYVSAAPNDLVAQARALGQSEEAVAKDRKRRADRAMSEKLRRFAVTYVMTLSTAALVATAFVFELGGVTLDQPSAQRSAVVAASMAGAPDAMVSETRMEIFGFTVSIPIRATGE